MTLAFAAALLAPAADPGPAPVPAPLRKVATVRVDPGSGRLVRSLVVQPRVVAPVAVTADAPAPEPSRLKAGSPVKEIVEDAARRHNIDPLLVHSVIQVESGYNTKAVSPVGARGLMQLMPATARRFGVKDSFSPQENIEAGVKYLKYLERMFGGDYRKALAAYNAGEGAVIRHNWVPPYRETQNYVYQVGKRWGEARRKAESASPRKSAAPPAEPPKPKIEEYVDPEGRLHLRVR